jgi:hypothetical protein
MSATNQPDFVERRNTAATAKKHLLNKVQESLKLDFPEAIASRAERASHAVANAARRDERVRTKREATARQKIDDEARALAESAAAQAELDAVTRAVSRETSRAEGRARSPLCRTKESQSVKASVPAFVLSVMARWQQHRETVNSVPALNTAFVDT